MTQITYDPLAPGRVREMVRSGLTDPEIRRELGINRATMIIWRLHHREFHEAFLRSDADKLKMCETALSKLAVGYERVVERVSLSRSKKPIVSRTLERVSGNLAAMQFWTSNKNPRQWLRHRAPPPCSTEPSEEQEKRQRRLQAFREFLLEQQSAANKTNT